MEENKNCECGCGCEEENVNGCGCGCGDEEESIIYVTFDDEDDTEVPCSVLDILNAMEENILRLLQNQRQTMKMKQKFISIVIQKMVKKLNQMISKQMKNGMMSLNYLIKTSLVILKMKNKKQGLGPIFLLRFSNVLRR